MKTTKEMIEIMKAFDEGKEIERCRIGFTDCSDMWIDDKNPDWNWLSFNYRIKKESKTRPMTFEEIVAYWKEHRTEIISYNGHSVKRVGYIIGYDPNDNSILIVDTWCAYEDVISICTKEDGTKFEVEIDDETR